jgi:hypothetical protein
MPTLKVVSVRALLEAAGFPEAAIVKALAGGLGKQGFWRLCTPIDDDDTDATASKFLKSIRKNINDDEKRSNFLVMLTAMAYAATEQDYGAVLASSIVTPKPAHKFTYQGKNHSVLEVKQGKKDRLYFFAEHFSGLPCLVLLLAHHKKDQTTPREVTNHCEAAMKTCLASTAKVAIK